MKRIIPLLLCVSLLFAVDIELQNGKKVPLRDIGISGDKVTLYPPVSGIGRNDIRMVVLHKSGGQMGGLDTSLAYPTDSLWRWAQHLEKKYPGQIAYVLIDYGKDILRSDGSELYRYHAATYIAKSDGVNYGSRSIWFEDGRSRARVLFGRTITPDGQELWLSPDDISVSSPASGAVFFSYGKRLSFSLPQVSPGVIVEYCYETDEYNPADTMFFNPGFYLGSDVPSCISRFDVELPRGKFFQYVAEHFDDTLASVPTITDNDSTQVYSWIRTDIPPFIDEPRSPGFGDIMPHIEGTIMKDWNYFYDWGTMMLKDRLVATEAVEAKTQEIIGDADNVWEKIARLFYFAQRDIHYISIKGSISSGKNGHPADFTLKRGYGDCTDKAVLFSTMLGLLGIEAHPISIMTNDRYTPTRKIPNLSSDHKIVLAFFGGRKVFFDPTATTIRLVPPSSPDDSTHYIRGDDMGITYLDPLGREIGYTPVTPPAKNYKQLTLKMALNDDGRLSGRIDYDLLGYYESRYRGYWEWQQPSKRPRIFADWLAGLIPSANIDSFYISDPGDLSTPFVMGLTFTADDYPDEAGKLWLVQIPGADNLLSFPEAALIKRKYPIEYSYPYRREIKGVLAIPEGIAVEYIPDSVDYETPYADFRGRYWQSDDGIHFDIRYDLRVRIVPVDGYDEFRSFAADVVNYLRSRIILKED